MVSFFDTFLKDDDHGGWKTGKQPPIKYVVRRGAACLGLLDESKEYGWRSEGEWPPSRTKYEQIYLHPDLFLKPEKLTNNGVLSYQGLT